MDHDIAVTLVSCVRMRSLNAFYRERPRATDVLSFRSADEAAGRHPEHAAVAAAMQSAAGAATYLPAAGDGDGELRVVRDLGDIVICPEVCGMHAAAQGWPLAEYLPLVAVHGVAHLAGYTHEGEEDYEGMKVAEAAALAKLFDVERRRGGGDVLSLNSVGDVRRRLRPGDMPASYLP